MTEEGDVNFKEN